MANANIDGELEADFAAIAHQAGCELVHAEFCGGSLRIFLDRPDGVTHEHCSQVSREVSALLDVADFGRGRYVLEVSSPGLDRRLYKPKDYERFCGQLVRITRIDPRTRAKETFVGRLVEYRPMDPETASTIVVSGPAEGERREIALSEIQQARLEIEL